MDVVSTFAIAMLDARAMQPPAVTDDADFEAIYRAHAPGVYRFCLSQLRDPHLAEDVAAASFTSAYAGWRRARFDSPEAVRPWIYRIARNAVCDEWRRQGRRRESPASEMVRGGVDAATAAGIRAELRAVIAAIDGLRERDRLIVGLRLGGGLSHAEVGAVLGMSERACITATARALERLRARLDAEGWR
jgi:RNA polymerase sigma factor (sigma-70 family)